jgi:hypothetical protein
MKTLLKTLVTGVAILFLIGMVYPAFEDVRIEARRSKCKAKLGALAMAILSYESSNQNLPPAFVADADGTAIHSWRQLITPYLDGASSAPSEYSLNQPWNSADNLQTEAEFKRLYGDYFCCPTKTQEYGESKTALTSYRLVTGPGTVFVLDNKAMLNDIAGAPSEHIMMIEVPSLIPARQPKDVSIQEALDILAPDIQTNRGHYINGVFVAMFDGSVHRLPFADDDQTREKYRKMLTPSNEKQDQ